MWSACQIWPTVELTAYIALKKRNWWVMIGIEWRLRLACVIRRAQGGSGFWSCRTATPLPDVDLGSIWIWWNSTLQLTALVLHYYTLASTEISNSAYVSDVGRLQAKLRVSAIHPPHRQSNSSSRGARVSVVLLLNSLQVCRVNKRSEDGEARQPAYVSGAPQAAPRSRLRALQNAPSAGCRPLTVAYCVLQFCYMLI